MKSPGEVSGWANSSSGSNTNRRDNKIAATGKKKKREAEAPLSYTKLRKQLLQQCFDIQC